MGGHRRRKTRQRDRGELVTAGDERVFSLVEELDLKVTNGEWIADPLQRVRDTIKLLDALDKAQTAALGGKAAFEPRRDRGAAVADMLRWLREAHGVSLQELGVEVRETGDGRGWGVFATREFGFADLVIAVPGPASLCASGVLPRHESLAALVSRFPVFQESSSVLLALCVCAEACAGADSPYAPYLRALPREYTTPLSYSLGEWGRLRACGGFANAVQFFRTVVKHYCELWRVVHGSRPEALPGRRFTWSLFRWATETAMTRQNNVPTPGADPDAFRAGAPGTAEVSLLPLMDLVNSEPGPHTIDFAAGAVAVRAKRPLAAGDEVLMHYGDRPSVLSLQWNGFVPRGGAVQDGVDLVLRLPDQGAKPRALVLRNLGLRALDNPVAAAACHAVWRTAPAPAAEAALAAECEGMSGLRAPLPRRADSGRLAPAPVFVLSVGAPGREAAVAVAVAAAEAAMAATGVPAAEGEEAVAAAEAGGTLREAVAHMRAQAAAAHAATEGHYWDLLGVGCALAASADAVKACVRAAVGAVAGARATRSPPQEGAVGRAVAGSVDSATRSRGVRVALAVVDAHLAAARREPPVGEGPAPRPEVATALERMLEIETSALEAARAWLVTQTDGTE